MPDRQLKVNSMCYAAMQTQSAKTFFRTFKFRPLAHSGLFDEKAVYPLHVMAFGRAAQGSGREYLAGQFGLVPPWVKDDKKGPKFGRNCYNARSESIFEKPSYKSAILRQRAVIPVDAFFEFPDHEKPLKHRYRVSRKDGSPFWLAGIWEFSPRYQLNSCSVVTTRPMELVAKFHSRSPVILGDGQLDAWLDPKLQDPQAIGAFLKPQGSGDFMLLEEDWELLKKGGASKV